MFRRRPAGLVAAMSGLLVLLSACGQTGSGGPAASSPATPAASTPAGTPSAVTSPSTPASAAPSASAGAVVRATVYYLGDTSRGPKLYREFRRVNSLGDPVVTAVDAMLHLPASDPDYQSLWPTSTRVLGVTVTGDLAVVNLSREARSGSAGSPAENMSLQQLAHTVTAANTAVRRVQLQIEGSVPDTLWGHADTRTPVTRGRQTEVLGPIWVIEPQHGSTVGRTFTARGDATVFEATVNWEVRACTSASSCGTRVLVDGFATASEGAPGRGVWQARVTLPAGSPRYVEFRAYESSAEDGRPLFTDSKIVRVA